MGEVSKRDKNSKFFERVAGTPLRELPKPRPVSGIHPAARLLGLVPSPDDRQPLDVAHGEDNSVVTAIDERVNHPQTILRSDETGKLDKRSGVSLTTSPTDGSVLISSETGAISVKGTSEVADSLTRTSEFEGAQRSRFSSPTFAVDFPVLTEPAQPAELQTVEFDSFLRVYSLRYSKTLLQICRAVIFHTVAQGQRSYVTTMDCLARESAATRRYTISLLKQLEDERVLMRQDALSPSGRQLGVRITFLLELA